MVNIKDIDEFVVDYPQPPTLPRSDIANINIRVAREEYDLIQELIHNPKTKSMWKGSIQGYMRWLLYYNSDQMRYLIEGGDFKPLALKMHENLRLHNMEVQLEDIDKYVQTKARQIAILFDGGMHKKAVDLYGDLLQFIHTEGKAVVPIFIKKMQEQPDLIRFRQWYIANDATTLEEVEKQWLI